MAVKASVTFFSYCREDSEFALRLAKDLKAAGANVWIDQLNIKPGREWDNAIEDAVSRSPQMLLILSAASVQSRNVRNEIAFALDEQKTIIPVLYKDCRVPLQLHRVQYIDFRTDYDRGLQALLKFRGLRQPPPGTRAPSPIRKKRQPAATGTAPRKGGSPRSGEKTKPTAKWVTVKQNHPVVSSLDAGATTEELTPTSTPSDKMLQAWEAKSESELHLLEAHSKDVRGVVLSADGRLAVSYAWHDSLKVWDLGSGQALCTLNQPDVSDVALSADGRLAVSVGWNLPLKVWDVTSGRELLSANVKAGSPSHVALSKDGRQALTASPHYPRGNTTPDMDMSIGLNVWDVASGREQCTLELVVKLFDHIGRLALSGDARLALIQCGQLVRVWDLESGRELRSFSSPGSNRYITFRGMALSADGSRALTGSPKTVNVWDVGTGRIVRSLEGHPFKVIDVALSADGRMAISASDGRTLNVWDAETGRELATFTAWFDLVCCAVSSDKTTIAAGDKKGVIHYLQI